MYSDRQAADYYNRGVDSDKLGRYDEAIASYDKALKINPNDSGAWHNRGTALGKLGRYAEALDSFNQALKIKTNDFNAWNNRGTALGKLSRYTEAIASYDQALKIEPGYTNAWYNRGNALGQLGQYTEAVASFDQAIKINPDHGSAWNNRGIALSKLGRYDEAVVSYDKALEINPNHSSAWDNRGNAVGKLGRTNAGTVVDISLGKGMMTANSVTATSVKCPSCGADVQSTKRFCVNCGGSLSETRPCPNCGAIVGKDAKFCKGCGREMGAESLGKVDKSGADDNSSSNATKVVCPECNTVHTPSETVCRKCGHQLSRQLPSNDRVIAPAKLGRDDKAGRTPALSPENTSSTAIPELFITLNQIPLTQLIWHKMEIQITNCGKVHAFSAVLSFSDDFETRLLKPTTVEAGTTKVVEIGVMPKTQGTIPIEVTLHYKDESNHEYVKTSEFWIEVQSQYVSSSQFKPDADMVQSAPLGSSQPLQVAGTFTMRSIPPEMTEKYIEYEFIGKGGFARVFKVKRRDGIYVAVKLPVYLDESTGKSFIAEMQNWTKFSHPNIVKIYDYNIMPLPYFEEELCDSSLDKIKKPLDPAKAAWIIFNICEGLKYAHARQVIHRDLKPQNILLKSGVPKISDWGLSKVVTDSTSSMTPAFTPFYAAPEQVSNKPKDQRTDIWQVGVILYELVTSSLPFTGDSMLEIVVSISTRDPVPPGDINPDAKIIEPVILRCMEKDPAKRYQSVTELQKDLAVILKMEFKESMRMSIGSNNVRQTAVLTSQLLGIVLIKHT
jgi:Flp pilus assembly protein TadD/ribosomal protein L40E